MNAIDKYHTVTVDLRAFPSHDNKVLIDGVEMRGVTDFVLATGVHEATKVTISFFANVRGTFGGVAIEDAIKGEAA